MPKIEELLREYDASAELCDVGGHTVEFVTRHDVARSVLAYVKALEEAVSLTSEHLHHALRDAGGHSIVVNFERCDNPICVKSRQLTEAIKGRQG